MPFKTVRNLLSHSPGGPRWWQSFWWGRKLRGRQHWPVEGSYIYQQPDRQTDIHYKVITVESSLFVGVYVRGFCGFFLHTNQEITSQRTSKVLTIHEHWLNRYDSTVLYLHKDWWHKNYISSLNNTAYIQTDWELNKENPETHLWL